MLTRLRFRRDFRMVARCLSDKPSDDDGKAPADNRPEIKDLKKSTESSTEKIQALLKSMLTQTKMSQEEYRQKFATAPERKHRQKNDQVEIFSEKIEENITKAASDVAQAIGGDVKQTEAELLSKVLGKINQTSTNLSDLLIGMKVDRSKDPDQPVQRDTRGQQVKKMVQRAKDENQTKRYIQRQPSQERKSMPQVSTMNIWSGEPMGIFSSKETREGTKLEVWENLKQRELVLATTQPPTNYFQKMILWTEQGKVWKFPIDNEQGMEEEANIHFSEHIFLDQHLEGWCPKKGPIRHFMELVCTGLSKNAFYTIQEKKDHIMWYKEYFESKKDLLTEVGAWNNISSDTKSEAST